jgi:thiol:disulfide interchange protein DsbC
MSRTSAFFFTLLAAGLFIAGPASAADESSLEAVRAKMNAMFDEIGAENVNVSPVDGWYTVHKGSIVAYVSEDGRYLLQGDLIDLDQQLNLSEQTRNESRRLLMSSIEDDQTIIFSPANPKYRVTVFTDVECTYCRKLHSQIDQYMAEGIEVRYMLYPRAGPASRSWKTSEDVWCAKDRNRALTSAKQDRDFETQKCDASAISRQYMIGEDIGLSGTPAIVFDDGTLVGGYLPPAELASRLQRATQTAKN